MQTLQRPSEAYTCYCAALEAEPAHPGALTALGGLLLSNGLLPEAADAYRRALAADPGNAMASLALVTARPAAVVPILLCPHHSHGARPGRLGVADRLPSSRFAG